MNSIEELKQQLILQKKAIEQKGGTVIVNGTNPSPAEITAGIKTIPTTSTANITSFSLNSQAQTITSEQEHELYQQCEQEELKKLASQEGQIQTVQTDTEQTLEQEPSIQSEEKQTTNQTDAQPESTLQTSETDQLEGQLNLFY